MFTELAGLEREASAELNCAGSGRTEGLGGAGCCLTERRRGADVVAVTRLVRDVERVEHLADDQQFVALFVGERFLQREILGEDAIAGRVVPGGQRESGDSGALRVERPGIVGVELPRQQPPVGCCRWLARSVPSASVGQRFGAAGGGRDCSRQVQRVHVTFSGTLADGRHIHAELKAPRHVIASGRHSGSDAAASACSWHRGSADPARRCWLAVRRADRKR